MLFVQRAVSVAVLSSGSRGNCTYVGDGVHGVLIDCGLATRRAIERMADVGLATAPITAVLVTHEHRDHVAAAAILDRRLGEGRAAPVPFYMTAGTRARLHPRVVPRDVRTVKAGVPFRVGGLTIEPILIPHDTPEPVAYVVDAAGMRIGVMTDLGHPTPLVTRAFATLDVAVIEFNHDPEMLMNGAYPWALKQRIRGPYGHLSNAQGAEIVASAGPRLRHIVLAHLSEDNNRPELARAAAARALAAIARTDVRVEVGSPYAPLRVELAHRAAPIAPRPAPPRMPTRRTRPPAIPPAQGRLFG